jgi:hypothetical protein
MDIFRTELTTSPQRQTSTPHEQEIIDAVFRRIGRELRWLVLYVGAVMLLSRLVGWPIQKQVRGTQ